jgi:hypothetical protein
MSVWHLAVRSYSPPNPTPNPTPGRGWLARAIQQTGRRVWWHLGSLFRAQNRSVSSHSLRMTQAQACPCCTHTGIRTAAGLGWTMGGEGASVTGTGTTALASSRKLRVPLGLPASLERASLIFRRRGCAARWEADASAGACPMPCRREQDGSRRPHAYDTVRLVQRIGFGGSALTSSGLGFGCSKLRFLRTDGRG